MSETLVHIDHVTRKYGDCIAVHDISLEITSGMKVCILGPEGAGKSTLAKIICGLVKPTKGSLHYGFYNNERQINRYIGYCSQEIIVWPYLSCYDQLVFMGRMYNLDRKAAVQRAEYYLAQLGLLQDRHRKAKYLNEDMKKRLNIGLSLIHEPELVILDEPLMGLEAQSQNLVKGFINNMSRHKTLIICTNHTDIAEQLCGHVALMDHGRLLLLNTPEKLKNSIGEGDTLQISMRGDASGYYQQLLDLLPNDVYISITGNSRITIRSNNITDYVPQITEKVNDAGGKIMNMELRTSTLSDVFLQLTGRPLHEGKVHEYQTRDIS